MVKKVLHGQVKNVTFRNSDNGWTVFQLMQDGDGFPITAVGSTTELQAGDEVELSGEWIKHKKFGKQFQFKTIQSGAPKSEAGLLRYLGSGGFPGIGPKTAERIVEHFGPKTYHVLENEAHRVHEVPGLGRKKAALFLDHWRQRFLKNSTMVFLGDIGLGPSTCEKIWKKFEDRTESIVKGNPYILVTTVRGIGFLKADAIARHVGTPADSPNRVCAAIRHILFTAIESGHSYAYAQQLFVRTGQLLRDIEFSEEFFTDCIDRLEINHEIHCDHPGETLDFEKTKIFDAELFEVETQIAENICRLALFAATKKISKEQSSSFLDHWQRESKMDLSSNQQQGVIGALSSKLFILTGGPGVGKTTTCKAIIKAFDHFGRSVALAAPTGRAAQKLAEVTGKEAKTIHRLLEWNPSEKGFSRNADNPLTADVVLVDESSMLDMHITLSLLAAIKSSAQIIFIGDPNQLPSVGPGNILTDFLTAETFSKVKLTEIFRQASASSIVTVAHQIDEGHTPKVSTCTDYTQNASEDCVFYDGINISEAIPFMAENPDRYGFKDWSDVQVLTPMNRGRLGAENLNLMIQETVNPASQDKQEQKVGNVLFRVGDRVIQTQNNYDLGVFNGDIGVVTALNSGDSIAIIDYNGTYVRYAKDEMMDVKLAYAITIHKSQGSEYDCAVIVLDTSHFVMLKKNLLYTALTRAKKQAIFLGSLKAFHMAASEKSITPRQTDLADKLANLI